MVKSFDENVSNFSYLLYDMTGKLFYKSNQLYQSSFHSDVLKNAASGTYVLLISTANKVYSTKIIKQ
ncbi:MAG TPA: T9SS type A sorting domain-containing protein [Chitinophagaceae bacterium]|nr:T9SS type A sorting domain-containing protein [Chitinophagaceae bacterium]